MSDAPSPFAPGEKPPVFTASQLATAHIAMANAAQSDAGTEKIADDINKITTASIAISQTFQNVGEKLLTIDALKLATPFFPAWDDMHTRFNTILWGSRDTASDIAAYAQQFTELILPFAAGNDLTPAQKLQLLNDFIDEAQKFKTNSAATDDLFTALSKDLGDFTTTFQGFAQTQKATDSQTIIDLGNEIAELNLEIDKYNTVILAMAIAIGCTILAGGAAAIAFPLCAPFILIIGLGAVIGELTTLIVYLEKKAADQNEINTKQQEIDNLKQQLQIISDAQVTLGTISGTDVPNMQTQLKMFDQVWLGAVSDCEQIIQWIELGEKEIDLPPVLAVLLAKTNTLYQTLGNSLLLYATGIDGSGVPKPGTPAPPQAAADKYL